MQKILTLVVTIGIALCLAACEEGAVYRNYTDFERPFWHKDSSAVFDFTISDAGQPYNLYFLPRYTLEYPYYNLYVRYALTGPGNDTLLAEMHEANLMNPSTGEPLGKGIGDMFDHQVLLQKNYQFADTGTYQIHITQYMRQDSLPAIPAAGFMVQQARRAE